MLELQFLYYYESLITRKQNLIDNFDILNAALQSELFNYIFIPPITYKEFKWAYNVITTRSFTLEIGEAKQGLIPFIELVNHGNLNGNCGYLYNSNEKTFELIAAKTYLPGDEIFVSYGLDKESDIILLQYGFMPDRNGPLSFLVFVVIPSTDPNYERKVIIRDENTLTLPHAIGKTSEIMNLLRVLLSNNDEVFKSDSLMDDYISGRKTADFVDEIRSIDFLITFSNNTLYEKYSPDKIDGEPVYLDISELTTMSRQAIQLRDTRRKLLLDSITDLTILKEEYLLEIENEKAIIREHNQIL